jgi:hypothetical protein
MKQAMILILIFAFLFSAFLLSSSPSRESTHTYTAKVQVIESNDNVYTVVDANGDVWEFESDNHYFINEVLTVRFDTMNTDTIYDDEIISIKK